MIQLKVVSSLVLLILGHLLKIILEFVSLNVLITLMVKTVLGNAFKIVVNGEHLPRT